jgi:hypothetical protein
VLELELLTPIFQTQISARSAPALGRCSHKTHLRVKASNIYTHGMAATRILGKLIHDMGSYKTFSLLKIILIKISALGGARALDMAGKPSWRCPKLRFRESQYR